LYADVCFIPADDCARDLRRAEKSEKDQSDSRKRDVLLTSNAIACFLMGLSIGEKIVPGLLNRLSHLPGQNAPVIEKSLRMLFVV
jgi:hypothetical protein